MCHPKGEFIVGDQDVFLGDIGESPFYIGRAQFEYWRHTQLIIDVVPGRGGMFSLEGGDEFFAPSSSGRQRRRRSARTSVGEFDRGLARSRKRSKGASFDGMHSIDALARYHRRCEAALRLALEETRAYESWRAFDPGEAASLDARFCALPALTKRQMNHCAPAGFVPRGRSLDDGLARGEVELVATSGTTAERVTNVWHQPWWDTSERASWQLNAHARRAATGNHREAILSSPLSVGFQSERGDLTFEQRRLGRFLFLNDRVDPLAWPAPHYGRMLDELERFRPRVVEASPSLLSRLCRWALAKGRCPFQPELVVLTYESPSRVHLRQIRAAFDAPVMSSYGTTESGYVFVECEHGRLHQNVESCRVDFVPLREDCGGPTLGKLLVTTFDNPWRSLLRFDSADLARLSPDPCPCGRSAGLTLASIEGRVACLTLTPEGAPVTPAEVDRRLAEVPGLDDYQLHQEDERTYVLRAAAGAGVGPSLERELMGALRSVYGADAQIRVAEAKELGPEVSGKYRLIRSALAIDVDAFLHPKHRPPPWPVPGSEPSA